MNKLCWLLIFFLPINFCFGQSEHLRQQISVNAGFHYNYVFNAERVKGEPYPCKECNQNVSFKSMPSFNYQLGVNYNYFFKNGLNLFTGLLYFRRTSVIEGIEDTIIKYSLLSPHYDPTVAFNPYYKVRDTYNSIEIPIFAGYKLNKFNFLAGIEYVYGYANKTTYYYIDGTEINSTGDFKTDVISHIYYSLRINYTVKIKDKMLVPYFAIDRRESDNYDFQLGVLIPFYNDWSK